MSAFHPSVALAVAALCVLLLRGRARAAAAVGGPLLALAAWAAMGAAAEPLRLAGFLLEPLKVDALGSLFALAFILAAALAGLYSAAEGRPAEQAGGLLMAAGAVGVALAGDWITLLFWWEAMTVASLVVIWEGGAAARAPGLRYLLVHAAGGSCLLAGAALHLAGGGPAAVGPLAPGGAAFWLILAAVLLNAAVPPLNAWLTDAYPACTVYGSVFQSAFTTKAAVYVLLRAFAGTDLLVPLGVAMALYGVVYAVLENDIRRLLAYHIVSQVGYMVAGAGLGTPLAVAGAAAHAFCHILYKALLFMGAGAAARAAGTGKLTELGGLAAAMPAAFGLYMVGALAISGAPGLNGFVSKSMVVAAMGEAGRGWAQTLLHLASVGTFLSIGLKLPYFAFLGRRQARGPAPVAWTMLAAMAAAAALCAGTGLFPEWLYARLPVPPDFRPYSLDKVLASLELLAGTALGFWLLRGKLGGKDAVSVDTDWLYRGPLASAVMGASSGATRAGAAAAAAGAGLLRRAGRLLGEGPGPARPLGATLSWLVAAFAAAALLAR